RYRYRSRYRDRVNTPLCPLTRARAKQRAAGAGGVCGRRDPGRRALGWRRARGRGRGRAAVVRARARFPPARRTLLGRTVRPLARLPEKAAVGLVPRLAQVAA